MQLDTENEKQLLQQQQQQQQQRKPSLNQVGKSNSIAAADGHQEGRGYNNNSNNSNNNNNGSGLASNGLQNDVMMKDMNQSDSYQQQTSSMVSQQRPRHSGNAPFMSMIMPSSISGAQSEPQQQQHPHQQHGSSSSSDQQTPHPTAQEMLKRVSRIARVGGGGAIWDRGNSGQN